MKLFPSITKEEFKEELAANVRSLSRKTLNKATTREIHDGLALTVRNLVTDKWIATHDEYNRLDVKTLYYLSMEFLMGRFLGNTLLALGEDEEVREIFAELGLSYNEIEEAERDPGLGNGGLGRLAACFLDSLSTLGYPAYGCGIRYRFGIFEQDIIDGHQVERPDNWLEFGDKWGIKRPEYSCEVSFFGNVAAHKNSDDTIKFTLENAQTVVAIPYDYPILGYGNNTVNSLRLWDAQAKNTFDLQSFNQGNYTKAVEDENLARQLCEVLYPADEFISGKELRLKQQYFFISASLQTAIAKFKERHNDLNFLPEKVVFQMNDTHPSVTVAELMRILMDEHGLQWNEAWEITQKTCAYTNHTIMPEALEMWPAELLSRLLPRIYMIIEEINRRFCAELIYKYGEDPEKIRSMAIIADGQVRMANLAVVGSYSVNGVAAIHTEIVKNTIFKDFYNVWPERFNNKTNGITQRRWLLHCNPGLSSLIRNTIGDDFATDLDELRKLEPFADDRAFRDEFMKVKRKNKAQLSDHILAECGLSVDPDSIFDIQIKRLHEYKRQLLNALHILDLYYQLKINPNFDMVPRTFIFSAKAAASYRRAKLIIKLINDIAELVNNDTSIDGKIKVLFMKNYRVSLAEKLIPAADLSEQISTAGKEASGTGNMKFMLNGAITIGTMDGANVEIFEEVGDDNIFIFGMSVQQVQDLYRSGEYSPWDIYNMNHNLRKALTSLIDGSLNPREPDIFREIYEMLLNGTGGSMADEYFILKDYESYAKAQMRADEAYRDIDRWGKSAILNTARSGKFSSDRTIKQYAKEIWKLSPVDIKM
ncbi:MAG: glycogen/starch/alpha-glucan phosphorylase [Defluviitaleaceae bacterium]|nr:glycogen/starch/alpha-glucan phosphorylase [Defluviitaleaceae bacterium]